MEQATLPKNVSLEPFKRVLTTCLAPKKERILIIGDYGTEQSQIGPLVTRCYASACKELGLNYEVVFQKARIKGEKADEKVVRKLKELPEGSIIVLSISMFVGTLGDVGLSFRKFAHVKNHRFISASGLAGIPDSDPELFFKAIDIDYDALKKRGDSIKKYFDKAKKIRITTPAGTDVVVDVENMLAVNNAGSYQEPGTGGNLPAGEVYIPPLPTGVDGTLVIDGSLRTRKGTFLIEDQPVTLTIKKGDIIEIEGGDYAEKLRKTLEWAKQHAKHPERATKICEFGLGTNPSSQLIGTTILDEKCLGTCHLAIGSNAWFGGSLYSKIHLDQVLKDPTVYVDDVELPSVKDL